MSCKPIRFRLREAGLTCSPTGCRKVSTTKTIMGIKCTGSRSRREGMVSIDWRIDAPVQTVPFQTLDVAVPGKTVTLLLPVAIASSATLTVYHEVTLRRKNMRVRDVLERIFKFYNEDEVFPGDLSYVTPVSPDMRKFARDHLSAFCDNPLSIQTLRFRDFLGSTTTFDALRPEEGRKLKLILK